MSYDEKTYLRGARGYNLPALHAVEEVDDLLSEPLETDNLQQLDKQLARAEAWFGRVSFQHRNAERVLSELKKVMLPPKSKEYTDLDRQITIDEAVKDQQCVVDLLKDQAENLGRRISLGQSMKKSFTEELRKGLR